MKKEQKQSNKEIVRFHSHPHSQACASMHTARVSLLFVCRSKKLNLYVRVSVCMVDGRSSSNSCNPLQTKAASKQAEQLGGFGDRGNMLIVKRKQQNYE